MPPNILHQSNILTSNDLLNENKNLPEDDPDGNIHGKNTSGARYCVFNPFNDGEPGSNLEFILQSTF